MCKFNLIQEPGGHSSKSEFGVRSDPGHAPAPSCLPLTLGQAGGHLGKVNLAQILLFMKSLQYLELKHIFFRNMDSAARDYSDHLGELERKIIQIVDAALQHQLAR